MSEQTYRTRYGIKTGQQAAHAMLESANFRLRFLEIVIEEACASGEGFNLPEYTGEGLARILGDIAYDVAEVRFFHEGISDCPGKIGVAPGVAA